MADKKSIWYKLGQALAVSNIPEVKAVISDPTAQLGYNVGLRLSDFFNNLPEDLLAELQFTYPTTPEAQLGMMAGEELAENIGEFRDGLNSFEVPEEDVEPDPLIAGFVEPETREERIARTEGIRQQYAPGDKPLSVQEQQKNYIDKGLEAGDFSDAQLSFVQTMMPADLPFIGLGGTITPTEPGKTPLYVEGMQYGLFNGMSAEELINVQIALLEADYLYPGSFEAGVLDTATITAIGNAMTVQNLQGRTDPVLSSNQSLQLALSGSGPSVARDIRNFFVAELKKDEPGTGDAGLGISESINLFPEFSVIYGETAAEQILGRKLRKEERALMGSYYNAAVQEASVEVQEMLKEREEARKEAEETRLRTEQIRLQTGLPEGVYSVEAPPQFTAAPGDVGTGQQIQALVTTLAGQRFEDRIKSIGAYASELEAGEKEAAMKARSRAFNVALNSTGAGALGE